MNIYSKEDFPVDEELDDLSEFFRIFGDRTRLQILFLLLQDPGKGVGAIAEELELHQTVISHQLQILRHLRLVRYRKSGRNVYYSLNDSHIKDILMIGIAHLQEGS